MAAGDRTRAFPPLNQVRSVPEGYGASEGLKRARRQPHIRHTFGGRHNWAFLVWADHPEHARTAYMHVAPLLVAFRGRAGSVASEPTSRDREPCRAADRL